MQRFAWHGTLIVATNFLLTGWHLYVLGKLHPAMTGTQLLLFGIAINLIPSAAAALLWTRLRQIAGWLFAIFFGAVMLIGGYEHFLRAGPDNFFEMAAGAWTQSYRISAGLLLLVDALGCWVGVRMAAVVPKT